MRRTLVAGAGMPCWMLASMAGCQLIAGLDDLETTAVPPGAGGGAGEGGSCMLLEPGPCTPEMGGCIGSCNEGDLCTITCGGDAMCPDPGGNVTCGPPELTHHCEINCGDRCAGESIRCGGNAICDIRCTDPGSCFGSDIFCGEGACNLHCAAGACDAATTLHCTGSACSATCQGNPGIQILDGADSCELVSNGC